MKYLKLLLIYRIMYNLNNFIFYNLLFSPSKCRYVNLARELHRVNFVALSENEKLAFFLNLYNAMVIHAVIRIGCPEGVMDRRFFFSDFLYVVGGQPYSLNTINHGILRKNRRAPYTIVKPFGTGDKRLEVNGFNLGHLRNICNLYVSLFFRK